jgi:DNA repair photolyase
MIREVLCEAAIDYEYPPDGGKLPVIDAYDGCQLRCPYCFQWREQGWNEDILVKTNLPDVLARELEGWDLAQPLYVGSRGDPYMPLEERYGLTRSAIQVLYASGVPCFISTKADSAALARDIDLFLDYGDKLTICVGQANLHHLRATQDQRALPNILNANKFAELGINTWAFITPTLPGITDVDMMIDALHRTIPVYLDKLRLNEGGPCARRFFAFLRDVCPELEGRYRALVANGTDPYYEELKHKYGADPRVKFVFGDP